jgi:hypothetical protein
MLPTRALSRAAGALLATLAATFASTSAYAEPPPPRGDAEAYCAYVDATAGSQEALLVSPQVFGSYGIVNGNDAASATGDGAASLPPTQRLTVGLRYSVTGLVQGIATRDRAHAECERYTVESDLHRFVQANREIATAAAVRAQLGVLRDALAKGKDLVQRARASVERGQGTLQDLQAVEGRYDDLSQKLATAEELLAGLPERAAVAAPAALLQRRDAAERKVESADGALRRLAAFDLSVRGGYDRFFGTRDNLPLFAVVSLTFTPGALAQGGYEDRAREARVA